MFATEPHYMGTIQPYLASVIFHLFGVSSFTLRLSALILFGCFLLFIYLLTRLLYTHNMALLALLLLSLGTQFMFTPQIMVEGGVVETLMFASMLMLLSTWLALTTGRAAIGGWARWRLVLYGGWGLAAGAALWSDYLIGPWLLGASLLLVIFCWREWRKAGLVCLLIGFIIGTLPIILYNLHPVPGENLFQVIWNLLHSTVPGTTIDAFVRLKQCVGTFLYGLPMMSGLVPACTLNSLPAFTPMDAHVAMCVLLYQSAFSGTNLIRPILVCDRLFIFEICLSDRRLVLNGSWGLSYVVLLLLAAVLSAPALRDLRRLYRSQSGAWSHEKRRAAVQHAARLMLLLAAALTIALYALNPISGQRPWSTRYLTCVLVATPAILSPLWSGKNSISLLPQRFSLRFASALSMLRCVLIALILLSFLASTAMIAQSVPAATAHDQHEYQLVSDLLGRHITRIYSEYWTCGRIMFQSQEKIICAVVDDHMRVSHNRYEPYAKTVVADAHAAYIFPTDPVYTAYVNNCAKILLGSSMQYRRSVFDDYIIFVPV